MKVYFDTHVVLAAFATRGLRTDLFAYVLLEHGLLIDETVIRELRSKLRIELKLSKRAIDEIEALLRDQVVVSTPQKHLDLDISDVLVTGDAALQKLGKRAPLPIVSPRGLWDRLRGTEPRR